jgi:hypothetical protein
LVRHRHDGFIARQVPVAAGSDVEDLDDSLVIGSDARDVGAVGIQAAWHATISDHGTAHHTAAPHIRRLACAAHHTHSVVSTLRCRANERGGETRQQNVVPSRGAHGDALKRFIWEVMGGVGRPHRSLVVEGL